MEVTKRTTDEAEHHGKSEELFQATLQTVEKAVNRMPNRKIKSEVIKSLENVEQLHSLMLYNSTLLHAIVIRFYVRIFCHLEYFHK
jgi:hypothetical protein